MNGYFHSPEHLRALLHRLEADGPGAWRHDREAAEVMQLTLVKYGALARRHHRDPGDAAAAAFEAMRTRAVREADDPWAAVTRAVQLTLVVEEMADGLMCSPGQARRPAAYEFHEPQRLSDRESSIADYHPAFWVEPEQDRVGEREEQPKNEEPPTSAFHALDAAVKLFRVLGWPKDTAEAALELVCGRLAESGTRRNAHEYLRREHHARAFLDLDRRSWSTLLRVVLGSPNPELEYTRSGRGLLMRLMIGETLAELMQDDDLVADIESCADRITGAHHA